jgi:hypothetical protein
MYITTAHELQNKFKSGLLITGENDEGELEWIGSQDRWKDLEEKEAKDNYYNI